MILIGEYKIVTFSSSCDSDKPLYEFVVSVDEIEKLTGIDFIRNLRMELKINWKKVVIIKTGFSQIEMGWYYRND
jgi:DNA/RNA endonuclease G (NUC1)